MKTKYLKHLALSALAATVLAVPARATELSTTDKEFLGHYEKIHAALAADDLATAKTAATQLGEVGNTIATADKIATARSEFGKLSDRAVELAKNQDGYYVAHCPMVKKSWVQTSTEITNPYYGSEMLTCGVIQK